MTVTGYLQQREVLKAVRRAVRKAEFWPSPYDEFSMEYMDQNTFDRTYNYYIHGYNESSQNCESQMMTHYAMDNDSRFYMFSEENVNACNVM